MGEDEKQSWNGLIVIVNLLKKFHSEFFKNSHQLYYIAIESHAVAYVTNLKVIYPVRSFSRNCSVQCSTMLGIYRQQLLCVVVAVYSVDCWPKEGNSPSHTVSALCPGLCKKIPAKI